ncbi:alanine racemase [Klebsiella quasipneumoniae]|nr:alanine racemase [Klebsiella quasipneumoniae]
MTRPVVASIDLLALRQNLQIVRRAAPGSRLWAVVKANAYGHGVARVWSALSAADGFALLNLEEAILLREQGWKGPILLLEGFFHADELAVLDQYRLTTSVHSNWQIKALQQAKLRAPLDIYLKVNSGMNRLGFMPERVHTVWQQLRAISNVGEMTLMSHFAEAENPQGIVSRCAGSNRRRRGWIAHARWPTRRRRSGIRKRILTGFVPASCCMAHRPPGSGRISRTPA